MKAFAIGVAGAVVAIVLFFGGFTLGISGGEKQASSDLNQAAMRGQLVGESAQMQCIHWVDKWRTLVTSDPSGAGAPPTFGMYVELCGKPDSK